MTPEQLIACLPQRLARWASHLLAAELCYQTDPLLLAAIMDRESHGGDALAPKGPGGTGDFGHGRGLMQIDDRSHHSFVNSIFDDGTPLWRDPALNIMYAAKLLARNLAASRVEECAIAGYNCGLGRARAVYLALPKSADTKARLKAMDNITTGGDYVSHVLGKRSEFQAARGSVA